MVVPEKIIELVRDFEENKHEYTNSEVFDEENTKVKFLNPFFEALGWNVRNEGLSARFREVVFEDTLKIGKHTKAPDYSFRIGGEKVFFVEAKKPSRDLVNNKEHAFQVRRYGWSAKLPLCILTDFEEFAVYDTTIKPDKNQNASIGRIKYYKYTDYVDKWDEIYNIFSKEAVLSGRFDTYANNTKHDKKGTSEIDDEFLKEIEQWRLLLARNIALRNEDLSIEELNYAVQLTINRIIFLRIAEDRGIERYGQLEKLLQKENIYKGFAKICRIADEKYNSGLFHFNPYDKEDYTIDTYTLDLTIDDKVFKEIFKNLYYPNSPYEFSMISTEILGKIYEQFLGQVIRLTDAHQAKVEDKPEVKKAGGVYYTPQYIVDYIVEHTLGEKIQDKTPNQISKIRVLDPACGSGSFLIRAYQYLLDYHLDYYSNLERPPKDVIYTGRDGITRLTIQEKKRILKNNIYGVDLDTLAVEVTKLSLLLKVLEDQNKDQLEAQQKLFHERALPNLSSNIKNGNSLVNNKMLIGSDLDMDKIYELNPFDWENEFSCIFEDGGFDVIIGNPPYVKEATNRNAFDGLRKSPYYQGKMDLWYLFGCKVIDLAKKNGLISFIATNNWITNFGASKFRNKVSKEVKFELFFDFGNYKVFETASIQTMIYIMKKTSIDNVYHFNYAKLLGDKISAVEVNKLLRSEINNNKIIRFKTVFNRTENENNYFNFINKDISRVLDKFSNANVTYLNKNEISTGIDVHQDFLNKKGSEKLNIPKGSGIFVISEEEKNNLNLETNEFSLIKPYYTTFELSRYFTNPDNKFWVIYTKSDINKKIKNYPNIKQHFDKFKPVITSDNKPYGLHRARKEEIFTSEKIVATRKCLTPTFSYSNFDVYVSQTFMVINTERFNLKYLTGILNSSTIQFWLKYKGKMQGNNYQLDKEPLLKIPIILVSNELENKMIILVDEMIKLNEKLQKTNLPTERKLLQQRINFTDNEINLLVYELYGLTGEEIKIIEESL
ncbi:MAG: hypothetical protein BZ138_07420 [Methanosphaera sp. rholeuAM270]|nr:MAG: hypothetical protein BZ138_07420 [Methanosphaera sp. rholeuAM270]